jgi:hypothetical protein
MTGLASLWLPIVVAAIIVFVVSFVIHTVLPWHQGDYRAVPNQDRVMEALRPFAIPPGDYMLPCPASAAERRAPEFVEKLKRGPVMFVTVLPNGPAAMGKSLVQWFLYCLVVGVFAGYVAGRALPPGTPYLQVFRFAGTVAFVGYALALWPLSIWYRRAWTTTLKATVDGLVYGLLTAGTFGWLWPR